MIGVTITSPKFSKLAEEARERFMRFTGLNCVVVHTQSEGNYAAKLELPKMFNQTVVYFDADLWFIRKADLGAFNEQPEFLAVQDPGVHDPTHFPFHDSRKLGMDVLKYFNSGFFIFNSRHKEAFDIAQKAMVQYKLKDFGEQSYLNYGVQNTTTVKLISNTYNYIPLAEKYRARSMKVMSNPLTIHGAGYSQDIKLRAMNHLEFKYTNSNVE